MSLPGVTFAARWSTTLVVISVIATGICLVAGYPLLHAYPLPGALVLALPAIALLFCVRGYTLNGGMLLVTRALWSNAIPLRGLRSAEADPGLLAGSLRVFGNGGFFSFSGWHYNRKLGRYRAFLTHHDDAVVLRFDDRTIVISPHPPQKFVEAVTSARR